MLLRKSVTLQGGTATHRYRKGQQNLMRAHVTLSLIETCGVPHELP
jgi:hypothetical protein